jgi:hypothetical protein
MGSKILYEGSITVAATDYTHTVAREDEYAEAEIEALDERLTRVSRLTFTLDYPFDRPYACELITDAGASLRQIIDAVRRGFRVMYRGASHQAVPNLANVMVEGEFGRAMHAIEDLVIERIELDEETATLEIGIGS